VGCINGVFFSQVNDVMNVDTGFEPEQPVTCSLEIVC